MASIEFENNLEDLKAYYDYYLLNTVEGRKWKNKLHLLTQVTYLTGTLIVWGFFDLWIALGVLFLFEAGLFLRTGFRPGRWLAQRSIKNDLKRYMGSELENLTLTKTLEFSDDALTVRNKTEIHSFSWQRVKKIERATNHIFIHCGMRTIFIVPKRTFTSQEDFNDFDNLAKNLQEILENSSAATLPSVSDVIVV